MGKIIQIEVPEDVSESMIKKWVLDGMSKELTKKLILSILEKGLPLDEKEELKKFEKTREEVWTKIKEYYMKKIIL